MKIVFSFDDNHILNMKLADLFDKYGFKATFFINITPQRGKGLSPTQIRNLHDRGFEMGSHTIEHKLLPGQTEPQRKYTLHESKKALETLIESDVPGFCYPKGQFNSKILFEVEAEGYRYARTVGEGNTDIYEQDRYKITPTVQIYNKPYRRLLRIKRNITNRTSFSWTGGWKESAIKYIQSDKWLVHIWGHSWEIEEQGQWGELEDLLQWIKTREYEVANGIRGVPGIV